MEILSKLFGSPARVKIMRLFLLSPTTGFKGKDVAHRSRVQAGVARRELTLLRNIGFLKSRGKDFELSKAFPYRAEMEDLLINTDTLDKKTLGEDLRKLGRLKLLILSGIFIKDKGSRVDLLLVGDGLKRSRIEKKIKDLEAEIGVELRWAAFSTKEFTYRLNMYDKLVRDILDFPHEVVFKAKSSPTLSRTPTPRGASELSTETVKEP